MAKVTKDYGIIFDMDNTILASEIDFVRMKHEVFELLRQYLPPAPAVLKLSTGELIAEAARHGLAEHEVIKAWAVADRLEAEGMVGAQAEPGIIPQLQKLEPKCELTVLTNNSGQAAVRALKNAGLSPFFTQVLSRDDVPEMKPHPDGVWQLMKSRLAIKKWLLIGDSWLDGQAAQRAGIDFIAYGQNEPEYWQNYAVRPALYLRQWQEDAAARILALLE